MLNGEQQQRNWVVKKYLKFYVVLIDQVFIKPSYCQPWRFSLMTGSGKYGRLELFPFPVQRIQVPA